MTPLWGPRHVAAWESAVVPAHSKMAKSRNNMDLPMNTGKMPVPRWEDAMALP